MFDTAKYGAWAVIAGGSEGVGAELARQLAERGINLVLVARKPEPLAEIAEAVADLGVKVRTVQQDLLVPDALDRVREITDPLDVGLFVYNAGSNTYRGEFVESDEAGVQGVIDLNITAPLAFLRHFGNRLKHRGAGGVIVLGSVASFVGHASIAPYVAAKAFLRIFIEGLWVELKPHGVDVLELCLGLTRTPAMERLGYDFDKPGQKSSSPAVVAAEGLAHLAEGPSWIADGQLNGAKEKTSFPRATIVAGVDAEYRAMSAPEPAGNTL
ncbi:SDR family NAD(P)-dependent oxidoreductase [Nocardioides sp. Bht2]|uniref:SDR family NAD(P)-dependent oxidoreductase n=1 Tax=Nocardioides sp. Bht2 TaxID=3392297 RepID=UPI0039B45D45